MIPTLIVTLIVVSIFVFGLCKAASDTPVRPDPQLSTLKAKYQSALKRGDTRGQKYALLDLQAARIAQLRREVGK